MKYVYDDNPLGLSEHTCPKLSLYRAMERKAQRMQKIIETSKDPEKVARAKEILKYECVCY